MKCDIISFAVPADNNFNSVTSASRGCIKCNTHNMMDFAPYGYENMLCPIGQIEAAVDAGLAKISAAINAAPDNTVLRQAINSAIEQPPANNFAPTQLTELKIKA